MKTAGLSLLVGLVMAVVWLPGSAYGGRNLKNAEYYVALAEKYAAEGRNTVLASNIKSAQDLLSKATQEEQDDPKYGELKSRLEKITSKGAGKQEKTGEVAAKKEANAPSVTLNPKIVRWATKSLDRAENVLGDKAPLSESESTGVRQSLEQAQNELAKASTAEQQTAEYGKLKQRYDKAQAKYGAVLAAAASAVAKKDTEKRMQEAAREADGAAETATAAVAKERDAKLVEEIQDLERAYKQAIAVVSELSFSADVVSMKAYDAAAARGRSAMEKIKDDFDVLCKNHPETRDRRNHPNVCTAVQHAKRLGRPCDDLWFAQKREAAERFFGNRQAREQKIKESKERKEAWRTTTLLKGDRLRIYRENGIPQYWEGSFQSKGSPVSAVRADAWTYYSSWYEIPGQKGMFQDVTTYYLKGDKQTRKTQKANHSS